MVGSISLSLDIILSLPSWGALPSPVCTGLQIFYVSAILSCNALQSPLSSLCQGLCLSLNVGDLPHRGKLRCPEGSPDMRSEINKKTRCYRRTCEQIAVLDRKIADLEKRYKRAKRDKMRPFQYNIVLRFQV
ncbi:hypothetical protein CHS0354_008168 [Potamilus streckersoni]|uniref:Uncharacterized protein n=1 Tax=Potamilus streckersoni TaxID=2493646 RepID=A0AAE0RWC9_9BIVA|nr:hypothetical protein CHS0354_008168 [Potamilus streckersoni]